MLKFVSYLLGSETKNTPLPSSEVNEPFENVNRNSGNNNYFSKMPISRRKKSFNGSNTRTKKRNHLFETQGEDEKSIAKNLFAKDIKLLTKLSANEIVLYNNHDGYGYIYRIQYIQKRDEEVKKIKSTKLYERLNQLVLHKVTPHIFLTFGSAVFFPEDMPYKLQKTLGQYFIQREKGQLYCQISESGPDTNLMIKLTELVAYILKKDQENYKKDRIKIFLRIIYNIIFQYIWTNYIFSLIGLSYKPQKNNIILVLNSKNYLDNPFDDLFESKNKKYRSYTFNDSDGKPKTYYLEDLGIDLYIYKFKDAKFMPSGSTTDVIELQEIFHPIMADFYKNDTVLYDLVTSSEIFKQQYSPEDTVDSFIHTYINVFTKEYDYNNKSPAIKLSKEVFENNLLLWYVFKNIPRTKYPSDITTLINKYSSYVMALLPFFKCFENTNMLVFGNEPYKNELPNFMDIVKNTTTGYYEAVDSLLTISHEIKSLPVTPVKISDKQITSQYSTMPLFE